MTRDELTRARVAWLTKAVRSLLKFEFNGKDGSSDYAKMRVGEVDAALLEMEASFERGEMDFAAYVKEPDDQKASQLLKQMLAKEKGE